MAAAGPSFSQLRAQVKTIRRKVPGARIFGIRSAGRWTGERLRTVAGETYCIVQCDSPLQMREALIQDVSEASALILVSNLPDEQISYDIRVRIARRKFYTISDWQIVKELFQAREVDTRISQFAWVAQLLLDTAPADGYVPVATGVLDAETVWGVLLKHQLGLEPARPDLVALLRWSMDPARIARWQQVPTELREAARTWLRESAGPAAEGVLACLEKSRSTDALPVGLAVGVVFHAEAAGRLDRAAGRIEKFVGNMRLDQELARRWSGAAAEVVREIADLKERQTWLQRADEILKGIEADEYAYLSDSSPLGFHQRLARFGNVLLQIIESDTACVPEGLQQACDSVRGHDLAKPGSRVLERVEMAARLVRWIVSGRAAPVTAPRSLPEAAREHSVEGGFVDWARESLRAGESVRELAEAYVWLLAEVSKVIESRNRQFATLLRDWTAAGSRSDELIPIETVLDTIGAPLAANSPLLVLVVDGMSYGVYRELMEDLTHCEWVEIRPTRSLAPRSVMAALPSVTEVCRTSLLCGRLRQGQSSDEKLGFAEHPALLRHCRSGLPPVLFHKNAIQDTGDRGGLHAVLREIESPRRRVVGVVINAVDDHLLKGEQLDVRWTCDEIKVLGGLLHSARTADRFVIVLTDHGHVLDNQTEYRVGGEGDRWRAGGTPAADEVEVAGPRVVIPESHRLIAPWTERVRYGIKKNGYHGGVTMQEMVLPAAVLSPAGKDAPEGWSAVPVEAPEWWFDSRSWPGSAEPGSRTLESPATKAGPKRRGLLFDESMLEQVGGGQSTPASSGQTWLDQFFASAVLEDQKRVAGRIIPKDEVLRRMLTALSEHGGKLTSAALCQKMELPALRLHGVLAAVQRVINVEGYEILTRDQASDTVELNLELLRRQFELK